jgi:hypothetical protein
MQAGSEIVRRVGARRGRKKKESGSRAGIFSGFFYSRMTVASRRDYDSPRRRKGDGEAQQYFGGDFRSELPGNSHKKKGPKPLFDIQSAPPPRRAVRSASCAASLSALKRETGQS